MIKAVEAIDLLDQKFLLITEHHIFVFFLLVKCRQKLTKFRLIFEQDAADLGWFLGVGHKNFEHMKCPKKQMNKDS
jgi:hypothetical protein